jgi:hypothetical protein
MARKSMGKASKVLGGLGAMYALSKLPVGRGVRLGDPEADARIAKTTAEFSRRPLHELSDAEQADRAREDARRLAKLPLITDAEQAQYFSGIDNLVRTESGVPIRTPYGFLQQTNPSMRASRDFVALNPAEFKKGGAVKGWGKARGARKAKVY